MRNSPLVVGQIVENVRNGRAVVTAIHGTQKPESVHSVGGMIVTGGNASFDLVYFDAVRSYQVPESIVCGGLAWSVLDDVVSQDEIDSLLTSAAAREDKEAREKAEADAAYALEKCRLRESTKYAHLKKKEDNKGSECALVAANIRIELKKEFPGVKFSVTSRHYTCVTIKWTDGPTKESVEAITSKYKDGHFNGMEEIYEYNTSPFNEIFGGAQYVFDERSYSDEMIAKAIVHAREKFGVNAVPEHATVELYKQGGFWEIGRDYFYNGLNAEIHRILAELKA
ncbi:LPD29 domain-containing protein [Citrobacter sp. Cpo150]|uniref:LPD29 domain-containing protein n=1 Tax=Citrobacter sp. Cpo150 TaxID=2985154 RepID=UPI002576F5CD|nr:LPD29 domain-containing protein [Citrobacter sp. Cpo150]MDM2765773.1 hypothetical protein [Citrobacter sp. Cpo150]